ncbi:Stp1/IreP family PP2C-type Ser/Thr phosphatase [Syntrophomonas palmitatica]|uniref:Stp1/IreP family PP2C-type Ser/Thr phosphatase n=1 Tax=Syntrophomonas palmitatica TaxID=402877 RepID=UPI0006D22CBD|nr:Stp1/IreP family PP2C-type Ser/Thr phosphatase [Syntrophomonas palmitatica]
MEAAAISDIGLVRSDNEDSLLVRIEQGLFIVCDGMGGHKAGEVASSMAVKSIDDDLHKLPGPEIARKLNLAIEKANRMIWEQGRENPEWSEMGTTLTAAVIWDNHLTVANVGDSALYIISNQEIRKITRDHTLAQEMVKDGLLRSEDVRKSGYNHILTRALGVQHSVNIDNFEVEIKTGDIILLCSDGLSDIVWDDEIKDIVITHGQDLEKAVQELLKQALARGGFDNISIILIRI